MWALLALRECPRTFETHFTYVVSKYPSNTVPFCPKNLWEMLIPPTGAAGSTGSTSRTFLLDDMAQFSSMSVIFSYYASLEYNVM